MAPVRRAGHGQTASGQRATWSVAEGRLGRRWREAVAGEGSLRHALLLETDRQGRFSHLELATPAGLLTLHPEGDGTLHGNAVDAAGMRHVTGWPWAADGCVLIDGSPIASAAIAWLLRNVVPPGASTERTALILGPDLRLAVGRIRVARLEAERWQIESDAPFALDSDGLPALVDGASWSLEVDGAG